MTNLLFGKQLEDSKMIHRPLFLDETEYFERILENTPVLQSKELDGLENLEAWTADELASLSLNDKHLLDEKKTLQFSTPTRLDHWTESYARIYATPYITRHFDHEDWTAYNRISLCVRPEMPGFKFVSLHLQLINEGEEPVPDRYNREGCHNINLKNHEWNKVSVEIPHIARDKVTALKIGYDIIGNESEAVSRSCFYIGDLRLEKVERTAKWSGWEPAEGSLVICGSGYQPGALKTAIGGAGLADHFKLIDVDTGRVVLEKQVVKEENGQGAFSILDFSEVSREGRYLIVCGEQTTRTFPIAQDVWEDSIWKTINLFFCERCGYEVPGVHKYCHGNVLNHHEGKSVVANGGWHDAADMSQNLTNTAEAVYSFFHAALEQRNNVPLFERLVEEGKWGLDYMLRTRFGDGYRAMGSGGSVWTGHIIGACDQLDSEAQNLAIENFMAAAAEALAAQVLESIDPAQSMHLRQVAQEDFDFAYDKLDFEEYTESMDPARVSSPILLYSAGVLAACHIYEITGADYYREKAVEIARRVMGCQQTEYPDWEVPLTGFFYRDEEKKQIQHYNHRSHEHEPIMALGRLCRLFPEHPEWMDWYHSIVLYTEYYKTATRSTAPYFMSPASIYHEDEADLDAELFLNQQAFAHPGMLAEYRQQVRNGVKLGQGYYLRRFPTWFSYRGNNGLVLAGGNAAVFGADIRGDAALMQLALHQLEWTVGKNPFGQSLMLGEGYNYAQQYVCLPGPISGSICVGIQSYRDEDYPYWPQTNNAVYREMWVHPSIRYLLLASRINRPAILYGWLSDAPETLLEVECLATGEVTSVRTKPRTGEFRLSLPSGDYRFRWQGMTKRMTLIGGREYELKNGFTDYEATIREENGLASIQLSVSGKEDVEFTFRTANLEPLGPVTVAPGETVELKANVLNGDRPWLALAVPGGDLREALELLTDKEVVLG
ncbi:glycoside hydrolase family 9 protein [Paenibacillus physcomitrellae]|nr:glycoside hydrolase family 9 protein [Paenibacillus physcomitrellae]